MKRFFFQKSNSLNVIVLTFLKIAEFTDSSTAHIQMWVYANQTPFMKWGVSTASRKNRRAPNRNCAVWDFQFFQSENFLEDDFLGIILKHSPHQQHLSHPSSSTAPLLLMNLMCKSGLNQQFRSNCRPELPRKNWQVADKISFKNWIGTKRRIEKRRKY